MASINLMDGINPVSLFANDPNPLGASANSIKALNENQLMTEYVANEVITHLGNTAITESDVA